MRTYQFANDNHLIYGCNSSYLLPLEEVERELKQIK